MSDDIFKCKNGHYAERNSNGSCKECARLAHQRWLDSHPNKRKDRSEYSAHWRKENPEKYQAQKNTINERRRNASDEEKEIKNNKQREWRKKNPDKQKIYLRKYYEANKERTRILDKKWCEKNPDKVREMNRREQAKRRASQPKWANKEKIKMIYKNCPINYQVDHVIPINGELVCGLHVETNLQYLTSSENHSKCNSFDGTEFNGGSPLFKAPSLVKKADLKPHRAIHDPRNGSLMKSMKDHLMASNHFNFNVY